MLISCCLSRWSRCDGTARYPPSDRNITSRPSTHNANERLDESSVTRVLPLVPTGQKSLSSSNQANDASGPSGQTDAAGPQVDASAGQVVARWVPGGMLRTVELSVWLSDLSDLLGLV